MARIFSAFAAPVHFWALDHLFHRGGGGSKRVVGHLVIEEGQSIE
jgi:hypothetical protein